MLSNWTRRALGVASLGVCIVSAGACGPQIESDDTEYSVMEEGYSSTKSAGSNLLASQSIPAPNWGAVANGAWISADGQWFVTVKHASNYQIISGQVCKQGSGCSGIFRGEYLENKKVEFPHVPSSQTGRTFDNDPSLKRPKSIWVKTGCTLGVDTEPSAKGTHNLIANSSKKWGCYFNTTDLVLVSFARATQIPAWVTGKNAIDIANAAPSAQSDLPNLRPKIPVIDEQPTDPSASLPDPPSPTHADKVLANAVDCNALTRTAMLSLNTACQAGDVCEVGLTVKFCLMPPENPRNTDGRWRITRILSAARKIISKDENGQTTISWDDAAKASVFTNPANYALAWDTALVGESTYVSLTLSDETIVCGMLKTDEAALRQTAVKSECFAIRGSRRFHFYASFDR